MLVRLYSDYLAHDKPMRHYFQHFLVGMGGFIFTRWITDLPYTAPQALTFLLFSYLPDLDGLVSLFTGPRLPEKKKITDAVRAGDMKQAATLATIHHKKFNQLWIHNIIGLLVILGCFIVSTVTYQPFAINAFGGVLAHFLFDILDDAYQLHHINNWLWPFRELSTRFRL